MTEQLQSVLRAHLLRLDGQEDVCFASWHPSRGLARTTGLLHEPILPRNGDRKVHGNAEIMPAYVERAIGAALEKGTGLAVLHSHPNGFGWQGLSDDDAQTEARIAPSIQAATGLPLVGVTLAGRTNTWSARIWRRTGPRRYAPTFCESVRSVGRRLSVSLSEDRIGLEVGEELDRTVSAWGHHVQTELAHLTVGVVGVGSVGSVVVESLARIGVGRVVLIDFDRVETINLDRIVGATREDASGGRLKVSVSARVARAGATTSGFDASEEPYSVIEERLRTSHPGNRRWHPPRSAQTTWNQAR